MTKSTGSRNRSCGEVQVKRGRDEWQRSETSASQLLQAWRVLGPATFTRNKPRRQREVPLVMPRAVAGEEFDATS
jgi:hypothetical protein